MTLMKLTEAAYSTEAGEGPRRLLWLAADLIESVCSINAHQYGLRHYSGEKDLTLIVMGGSGGHWVVEGGATQIASDVEAIRSGHFPPDNPG